MSTPNFEQAKQYAFLRLERELSPKLLYHGISHTRDDVVPAVEKLARMEGIEGESLSLLLTAAWFHDIGFVEQPQYHELISARIAAQALPGFGYTDAQVETVRWAILATALPQAPQSLMEQILTDADLDVLGRDDFMVLNSKLRREFLFYGGEYSDREWFSSQIKFLESHTYFTAAAKQLRAPGQLKNIEELRRKLKELE